MSHLFHCRLQLQPKFVSLSRAADTPSGRGPIAVDDTSMFRIASTTKLFTSLGIIWLEADRKLSLDDSISRYVLSLPD